MPFVNEAKSPFANERPHMVITANMHLKTMAMQLERNVAK
jgi:hypothetical protein